VLHEWTGGPGACAFASTCSHQVAARPVRYLWMAYALAAALYLFAARIQLSSTRLVERERCIPRMGHGAPCRCRSDRPCLGSAACRSGAAAKPWHCGLPTATHRGTATALRAMQRPPGATCRSVHGLLHPKRQGTWRLLRASHPGRGPQRRVSRPARCPTECAHLHALAAAQQRQRSCLLAVGPPVRTLHDEAKPLIS
jgi:hypothetical protein